MGADQSYALNRQQEKVLRERNQALQVSTLYLPFWSKAHTVAGGAGEAGQADPGAGEREAGAGVAPAGERRSDQGDQNFLSGLRKSQQCNQGDVELFIVSQKKNPRCWRMRTWLLQLCLETSRNNSHRFYKVKTKIKLVSGKAFCQKQSEH